VTLVSESSGAKRGGIGGVDGSLAGKKPRIFRTHYRTGGLKNIHEIQPQLASNSGHRVKN